MPIGKTKDAGWQIGVSRALDAPLSTVWELLTGPRGLGILLGPDAVFPLAKGERYETADGIHGELRSYRHQDRIRLTWQPDRWLHDSTVQLAVADRRSRTMVRFHQERLADSAERDQQREYWTSALDRIERLLSER